MAVATQFDAGGDCVSHQGTLATLLMTAKETVWKIFGLAQAQVRTGKD